MNLLQNELEPLLTPGTIVAHFKRDAYLKTHRLDADFDKNMYLYQVCGLATDVNNITCHYVVYQAIYGRREVFVRAINDFLSPAGTDIDKRHVPRFSVYAEPVEVINPQIPAPKKHNEAKKLHKKIKNLAAEVKKLREENDQLKKEAANTHVLKKSVKNPSISVVTDSSGVVSEQGNHIKEDGTYESTTSHTVKNPSISVVPDTVKEASPICSTTGSYPRTIPTLADAPADPLSVKAKEIADKMTDKVEDILMQEMPKELVKCEKNC
jgi:hypothetical protein